jgi:hypothetical protein
MSQIIDELKRTHSKNLSQGDEGKPELSMSELLSGMVNQDSFITNQSLISLPTFKLVQKC